MITENIGEKIVTLIGSIVTLYLSEAQTETYPYAVYEQTVSPVTDKSQEAIAYTADTTIRLYSKDFSDIDTKLQSVKTAIANGMDGSQYSAALTSESKNCVDDVWCLEITYQIFQIS